VLIDIGISCREVEKRMQRSGLSIKKVKAIFISHEHGDHIKGVEVLSKRYEIPVYITEATHRSSALQLEGNLVTSFSAYAEVAIGQLLVKPFPKAHDAIDAHSFVVSSNGVRIAVITDIGNCCDHVIKNFRECHAAFLESNYDEQMLDEGSYPYHLKHRIRGGQGHISNRQALELFKAHRPAYMSHLILSHLSKNNNTPEIVEELFSKHANRTRIVIASRDEASEVFEISSNPALEPRKIVKVLKGAGVGQMSLF